MVALALLKTWYSGGTFARSGGGMALAERSDVPQAVEIKRYSPSKNRAHGPVNMWIVMAQPWKSMDQR